MKRYVIDPQTLKLVYPPMDERFERNMRAMIDTLPACRQRRHAAVKMRYAMAFALLMVLLLCATALAAYVVNMGFFSDVAELHQMAGAYDDWTLEEKESIVRSMEQYGVITDMAQWNDALAIFSEEKREKALDKLFSDRYGINGRTDVITAAGIVEQELGLYDPEWTLEQKAEYTQLMLELDLLGYDTNIDFLPDEDDIPQEQAVEIAKAAVQEAYGYDDATMDSYDVWVSFLLHRSEVGVKEPYYMLEFVGAGIEYHVVSISGKGEVLTSEEGYKGVTSPAENAVRQTATRQAEAIPKERRFADHVSMLELLETQICRREGKIADGVTGLVDGTAVVFGRMGYDAYHGDSAGAYAECIDEQGTTRWLIELPDENGEENMPEMVMQLEDSDLLMIVRRKKNGEQRQSIEYIRYDQLRISSTGSILERKELKPISEMAGDRPVRFDQMFVVPGHGGMLVSGYLGGKNIPFYAQLDESGEPLFTWQFEELLGHVPFLKTTDEGYVLTAWNEAANASILRFYDKQGQLLHEGENVEGIRINRVRSCGDGELLVTSGFMKDGEWVLARIDDHGKMLEKMVYTDKSAAINMPTEIVRVGCRYVYASNHQIDENAWGSHTAIMISDGDGSIKEYSAQGMNDFTDRVGYIHLAPVGNKKVMLVYTTQADEYKRDVQIAIMKIP